MEIPVKEQRTTMRQKMKEIQFFISWREIARIYFGKSSAWMYQKLDGRTGTGKVGDFTPKEKEQLRGALIDLSERLRRAAEAIE